MDIAYCGLNCKECPVWQASVRMDTAAKIRLAEEYSTDTCKFSKEDMFCMGCHSDMVSQKMCGDCEIRICVLKTGYKSCAECHDFPCSISERSLNHNSNNLELQKQSDMKNKKTE